MLMCLSGLLFPLAVRLLQVMPMCVSPTRVSAHKVIEPLMLAVVARRSSKSLATIAGGDVACSVRVSVET